jgi:hypothetical protein
MIAKSALRNIYVIGPKIADEPLWEVGVDVVYTNEAGLTLVDRNPSLRSLALANKATKVTYGGKPVELQTPALLKARLRLDGGVSLQTPAGLSDGLNIAGDSLVADAVLSPAVAWPQVSIPSPHGGYDITVPSFELVSGAINVPLKKAGKLADYLGCNNARTTALGGLALVGAAPVARLVPQGIELDITVPNPVRDFLKAGASATLAVRLRIEAGATRGACRARLIGLLENDEPGSMLKAMEDAFEDLVRRQASLRARLAAPRPALLPIRWHLHGEKALSFAPQNKEYQWRADLDPDLISVQLETDPSLGAVRPSIAQLKGDRATLWLTRKTVSNAVSETELAYGTGKAPEEKRIRANYQGGEKYALATLTSDALPVFADYVRASDVTEKERPTVFLPVRQGTLQLPTTVETAAPIAELHDAFQGNCVLAANGVHVDIDAAVNASVALAWRAGIPQAIDAEFEKPRGIMRRGLWIAQEEPTETRLLPTGRLDPAASRDILMMIGGQNPANGQLTFENLASWTFAVDVTAGATAILWRHCNELPLVSAGAMLSAAPVAGPSELRSLLPLALKNHLELRGGAENTPIPSLKACATGIHASWPLPPDGRDWGAPTVALVSPTTPGVEYKLRSTLFEVDQVMPLAAAMRYDLPVLDELFAGMQPPPEKGQSKAPLRADISTASYGVADSAATAAFWQQQAFILATTRTQVVRATAWTELSTQLGEDGARTPGPLSLVEPYDVSADVSFGYSYPVSGQITPLGNYYVHWKNEDQQYSGKAALLGFGGEAPLNFSVLNGKLVKAAGTGKIGVVGFAPAAYKGPDDLLVDTRGTGLADSVRATQGRRWRAFVAESRGELLTLDKPVSLKDLSGDYYFWVRDLPLVDGVFDGSTSSVEGRLGADDSPFQRGHLVSSIYEWRVYGTGKSGSHDLKLGKFRLTPLRLLRYQEPDSNAEAKTAHAVEILCRAALDVGLENGNEQEAFHDDYPFKAGHLLKLQFTWDSGNLKLDGTIWQGLADNATSLSELRNLDDDELVFPINPKLTTLIGALKHVAPDTVAGELKIRISTTGLGTATLNLTILGSECSIRGTLTDQGFKSDAVAPGGDLLDELRVIDATLTFGATSTAATIRIGGAVLLPREEQDPPGAPAPPAALLRIDEKDIYWLGTIALDVLATSPHDLLVDHARGSVHFRPDGVGDIVTLKPWQPITGLTFSSISGFGCTFTLVAGAVDNGRWPITAGTLQSKVSGKFGDKAVEVSATMSRETNPDTDTTVRIWLSYTDANFAPSIISWDPDGLTVAGATDLANAKHAAVTTTASGKPWTHKVKAVLDRHEIPADHLVGDPHTGRPVLDKPLQLIARIAHGLERGHTKHGWFSFEPVVLTSLAAWVKDKEPPYQFGPRYQTVAAKYRNKTNNTVVVAGIGRRSDMLSGFDDPMLIAKLKAAQDQTSLLLIGGAPGLSRGRCTIQFSLPWLIPFDTSVKEDAQRALEQLMAFGTTRKWRAGRLDATVSAWSGDALPPVLAISSNSTSQRTLSAKLAGLSARNDPMARGVQQAFFEAAAAEPPVAEWPFFLSSLVALKHMLAGGEPLDIATLLFTAAEQRPVLVTATKENHDERLGLPSFTLQVFARSGALLKLPLDAAKFMHSPRDVLDTLGQIRLQQLVEGHMAEPDAASIVECDALGDPLRSHGFSLPTSALEFGRMRQELVARANMVYASPARGWPQVPATDVTGTVAVPHALKGTADNAAVSELAGLSARSAAFGLASFGGDTSDGAVYIASQARAAFHHGEGATARLVSGRPGLHMTALSPRVRTPVKSARELAMEKAGAGERAGGGIAKSAVFLPPAFSRSLVGERPGIVETTIDVILAEGTDLALQAGDASFGRSATAAPAVMRQVRMPRSPALPIEDRVNLETRRRTYVSLADASPPNSADKLLPLLAASSAATMWRHRWAADQSTHYEARFLLELLDPLDAGKIEESAKANQLPCLQLRLRLRLWTDNSPDDDSSVLTEPSATEAIARTRILDAAFWLTIGKDQFQATKLAQTKALAIVDDEAIVPLVLNFDYVQASAIVALLQDPDPNVKATLNARLERFPD